LRRGDGPGRPPSEREETTVRIRTTVIALGVAAALAASGCAAESFGEGVIEFAKQEAGMRDSAPAREIILDLNPDATSLPRILKAVRPVVADAAAEGAVIEAWVVTGGVASAMAPVDLEGANNGDLRPVGKNNTAWKDEAANNVERVMKAIEVALTSYRRDGTGADLFGALATAAQRATQLPGSETAEVVLVSNGIHRTSEGVDLQRVDFSEISASDLIADIDPLQAPTVSVVVLGAGNFPGVSPPPAPTWTNGIRATWVQYCELANAKSCSIRDVYPSRGEK
jgi:hypothetical protein